MPSGRFRVRGCHPLWPRFPARSAIVLSPHCRRSYNPARCLDTRGLGSCAFARHYWRNHCYFLFLRVLRCFSSPRSLYSIRSSDGIATAGFPHSDTSASSLPYSFTELFAVWRVLLQFRVARHSPYALPYLISGSRVFRDVLFQELFFTVFSVYLTTYVLDLFCYVFSS